MTVAPERRVQRNLQTLGILWCIFGAYRIIGGLIAILVMGAVTLTSFVHGGWGWGGHFNGMSFPPIPLGFVLVPIILVIASLTAFLALFVGYGLLKRQPWGRVLGIIVAILSLWKFPFGTALGIYTLWVLVPAESGMEYDAIASR